MDWLAHLDGKWLWLFGLVLTRISGLVVTAPIFGGTEIPMQFRALLAFSLTVLIMPSQVHVVIEDPPTIIHYATMVAGEILIGVALGLALVVLFSGIQMAGGVIGQVGGLLLAETVDPTSGGSIPIFSRLLWLIALAIFVAIGGHRVLMSGLLDTFQTIPPGDAVVTELYGHAFVQIIALSFDLALRASAPIVTALLLSTLVMGLISRTVPQLNIMIVGFGLNSMITFAALTLAVGGITWIFEQQVTTALEAILEAMHAPLRDRWLG